MTREEAIKMIQDDMRLHHDYLSGKYRKALRMAIEALQAESTHGRLIDADALMEYCSNQKTKTISNNDIARFPTAQADRPHGEWVSQIDTGTWMLECSVCGCRVQEEKYRIAVGEDATKCPYCGAELGLGGYLYDEYANRPSQRKGEDE